MRSYLWGLLVGIVLALFVGFRYFSSYSLSLFGGPPNLSDDDIRDIAFDANITESKPSDYNPMVPRPRYLVYSNFVAGSRNNASSPSIILCTNTGEEIKDRAYRLNIYSDGSAEDTTIEYKETPQYFEVKFLGSKRTYRAHKCTYFDPSGFNTWSTGTLLGIFGVRPINTGNFSILMRYLIDIGYPKLGPFDKIIYEDVIETGNILEYRIYNIMGVANGTPPNGGCGFASLSIHRIDVDKISGEVRINRDYAGSRRVDEKDCQSSNDIGTPGGFAPNIQD